MKPTLIYRKNVLFRIDEKVLPEAANTQPVKGALFAAIYVEFRGAAFSDKYKNTTVEERMQQVNDFAWQWLEERGYS